MFVYKGRRIDTLLLSGGGSSMLGILVTMLDELGVSLASTRGLSIHGSSAGSLAILGLVLRHFGMSAADVRRTFTHCTAVIAEHVAHGGSVWKALQSDRATLTSMEALEPLLAKDVPLRVRQLTFRDLHALNPDMTIGVHCCRVSTERTFVPREFSARRTPSCSFWKACWASCAVPFVFAPVPLQGQPHFDAAVVDWTRRFTSPSTVLFILGESWFDNIVRTCRQDVPFVDNVLHMLAVAVNTLIHKSTRVKGGDAESRMYRFLTDASITRAPFDAELVELGRRAAAELQAGARDEKREGAAEAREREDAAASGA